MSINAKICVYVTTHATSLIRNKVCRKIHKTLGNKWNLIVKQIFMTMCEKRHNFVYKVNIDTILRFTF